MTMRSLGAAVGVDPTAVYRHFPTKEELVNALVDQFLVNILSATNAKITQPRDRIFNRAMCTATVLHLPGYSLVKETQLISPRLLCQKRTSQRQSRCFRRCGDEVQRARRRPPVRQYQAQQTPTELPSGNHLHYWSAS